MSNWTINIDAAKILEGELNESSCTSELVK